MSGPPPALTPAIYAELLRAYRAGCSDRAAGRQAGCSRDTASKAFTGHYAKALFWAPAIRDVVAGLIPEPTMPRIWPPPTMPRLEPAPLPPRLSVVPKPKPETPATSATDAPEPLPAPPPRSTATETAITPTGNDGLDALAEYRVSLTQRVRSMASAGLDIDRVVKWEAAALVEFAESMSQRGASVSLSDLTAMAQALGLVVACMEKFGTALERVVAAEAKLRPKDAPSDDGFAAAQAAAQAAASRKRATG